MEENFPHDIARFVSRAPIDDLFQAKERELAKGPLLARWWFVQLIDAELYSRKANKSG